MAFLLETLSVMLQPNWQTPMSDDTEGKTTKNEAPAPRGGGDSLWPGYVEFRRRFFSDALVIEQPGKYLLLIYGYCFGFLTPIPVKL